MTCLAPSRNSIVQGSWQTQLSLRHNGSSPTFFLKEKLFLIGFYFSLSALSCVNRNDQRERASSSSPESRWELVAYHLLLSSCFPTFPGFPPPSCVGGGGGAATGMFMYCSNTPPALLRESFLISHLPSITQQICALSRTSLYRT